MTPWMRALCATVLLVTAACGRSQVPAGPSVTVNGKTLQLEVADSPSERQMGLMNRTKLGRDAGMIFVFPEPTVGGFWMKNTLIPLSIAFVDGDKIVAIREMTPCRSDPCPSYTPDAPYDQAIEANSGWFTRAKASAGTTVVLKDIQAQPT